MTDVHVLFELPKEIEKGLAEGTYERVGGVIRKTGDKQVVTWLSEVGENLPEESQIPSILSSPQLLMGLQVANIAVSVAGFAMIHHKLRQVERQLQGIDQKLADIARAQNWLDKKTLIGQLAPTISAMNTLASVHRMDDERLIRDKLASADDRLDVASVYFRQLLGQMLAEKLELERPEEFSACYRAWLMAGHGRIQTMAELGEMREAHYRAESFKVEHADFGREFIAARREPLRKHSPGRNNPAANEMMVELGQQSAGAHELILGKVLQLEHMKNNNLQMNDLLVEELNASEAKYAFYLA